MKRLCIGLGVVTALTMAVGCSTSPDDAEPELSRDEARRLQGKLDGFDICELYGWYGDGVCDEFCPAPDQDCESGCVTADDCPTIYCITSPCPQLVCEAGECVIDVGDSCDLGERECSTCTDDTICVDATVSCPLLVCPPPVCPDGQRECSTCTGATTCVDESVSCPLYECPPPCESNDECDSDELCDYGDNACGGVGHCMTAPTACPRHIDPVCGCDGDTYSNACTARSRGVAVDHDGPCEGCTTDDQCPQPYCLPGGPCPTNACVEGECQLLTGTECTRDSHCVDGLFCESDKGVCGGVGTCTEPSTACPRHIDPVCGCDGETYSNACTARARSASIEHDGACETTCAPVFTCALYCPFGYATDADGCDLCSCLPAPDLSPCREAGCSGQLCIPEDSPPIFTTCEWFPHYACYDSGTCERQDDGECGWTQTPELIACIEDAS